MNTGLKSFTKVLANRLDVPADELIDCFRPCNQEELGIVVEMREREFGVSHRADKKYLIWRYYSHRADSLTLFVLALRGQIVAALGTERVSVRAGESKYAAVKTMDTIVHPNYQGVGIGPWMTLVQFDRHEVVLGLGGNNRSLPQLRRLFQNLAIRTAYVLPIKAADFARRRIAKSKVLDVAAPAINSLSKNAVLLRLKAKPSSLAGFDFLRLSSDELADQLGESEIRMGDNFIVRDREYLRWRYSNDSGRNYTIFGLLRDKRVQSFVVSKVGESNVDGKPTAFILDWGFKSSDGDHATFTALMRKVCRELVDLGVSSIQIVLNDTPTERIVKNLGFIQRATDERFFIRAQEHVDRGLFDPSKWFITLGDSDQI